MDAYFAENICLAAPGLGINGTGNATVKYANTFSVRANGRVSTNVTTAAVATATFVAATLTTPFPNGTASTAGVLATGFARTYALVATVNAAGASFTSALTFAFLASADFATGADMPLTANYPQAPQSNQTVVGWVTVQNISGSNFTPGTTALDATGIKVIYQDNYAVLGS